MSDVDKMTKKYTNLQLGSPCLFLHFLSHMLALAHENHQITYVDQTVNIQLQLSDHMQSNAILLYVLNYMSCFIFFGHFSGLYIVDNIQNTYKV